MARQFVKIFITILYHRQQSGHETDREAIDRLSTQLQTMQGMIQELIYQHQGKKGCCISQERRLPPSTNVLNHFKKERNSQESPMQDPATTGRAVKSFGDAGGLVGGGANFGGFISSSPINNRNFGRKETSA